MAGISLSYGLDETKDMKNILANVAEDWDIVSGGGIDSVTVVSGDGKASIDNDTLYLSFPTVEAVDTSTFITGASINAGSVSIADNTLLIDIPTVSVDTSTFITGASINSGSVSVKSNTLIIDIPTVDAVDTSTFITSASINSGSVSVADNTLMISIPTISGGGVESVSVVSSIGSASIDDDVLYIDFPTGAGVTDVTVISGGILASIDSGTLYILAADNPPKASANFQVFPQNATVEIGDDFTVTASHLGDGVISFIPAARQTIDANTFVIATAGKTGSVSAFLSETQDYYAAAKNISITKVYPSSTIRFPFSDSLLDDKGLFYRKPTDTKEVTFAEGGVKAGFTLYSDSVKFGGKSFTFDWWQKGRGNVPFYAYFGINNRAEVYNNVQYSLSPLFAYGEWAANINGRNVIKYNIAYLLNFNKWCHFAWTYDHLTGIHRYFQDGVKIATVECSFSLEAEEGTTWAFDNFEGYTPTDQCLIKDFRFTPDKCLWREGFGV